LQLNYLSIFKQNFIKINNKKSVITN